MPHQMTYSLSYITYFLFLCHINILMSFSATQPFDLPELPPSAICNNETFNRQLLLARTELAELKGYSSSLPNPMLLLSPAIIKESVASSEIENINTTVEKVLQQQLFPES